MRFEEAYTSWQDRRLTQEEAARLLGVCERTFRRYIDRYEEAGLAGLEDRRLNEVSHRKAAVDEVLRLEALYRERYDGWNVKHFMERYRGEHGGTRSYTWVKRRLQTAGLVKAGRRRGKHRLRRPRAPMPGMLIHQDASTHAWVPDQKWDLVVTMDDATSEVYSGFFVEQEGTLSSFQGVHETIAKHGLFSSFYSDRGSHYWITPVAGGKVDKRNLSQFGRAMQQLGIQMIAAYSPEARGRSERLFRTLQERLPKELALEGITTMDAANAFLRTRYWAAFNRTFRVQAREPGTAFVPLLGVQIDDILCIQAERTVGRDNCVSYEGRSLQIPADKHRCHYVKARVRVHAYADGTCAVFHGPRKLASYDTDGRLMEAKKTKRKAA
jgi:transposase